jgi:phage-related protein
MKRVQFLGKSLDRIRSFPEDVRQQIGYQIDRVQRGMEPTDWKPFKDAGMGVKEIRIRDEQGIFRVVYLARFGEFVYILHAFQKKSQKIAASDMNIIRKHYAEVKR